MENNRIVVSIKDNIIWTQIFNETGHIESSYISDTEIEALQKAQDFLGQKGNVVEELKDKLHRRNMQIKELKKQLAEVIERNEDIYGNREKFSDGHPRTKNQ